jgi:hypothetical protein
LAVSTVAFVAPNQTILEDGVTPKLAPLIVTIVPTGPDNGVNELILGCAKTSKGKKMDERRMNLLIPQVSEVMPMHSFGMGY